MKHLRFAALTLTLLLAACGGGGTTPTPPTTPVTPPTTPVTPPVTPVEPITPPADGAPIINSFTASPPAIDSGGTTTLSWSVTNSEIIRITPDPGQGDLSSATSVTVSPTTTTTYNMEAVSLNGLTDTASVTVTVGGGTGQPPTGDVPYYGEWEWNLIAENTGSEIPGQLSISAAAIRQGFSNAGRGEYQFCPENGCVPSTTVNPVPFGIVTMGDFTLSSGTTNLTVVLENQLGEPYVQLVAIDVDGNLTNDTFEGVASLLDDDGDELISGTFVMTKISDTPVFQD